MNEKLFANRMGTAHKSFIRAILKVTENPKIISTGEHLEHQDFARHGIKFQQMYLEVS
jgi:methyl coenzyme M reductase subunit C